jgi:hypothetical protein
MLTVFACFGFFEFYTWASLFKTTAALAIFVVVEILIGAAGMVWIWWESRKASQSK